MKQTRTKERLLSLLLTLIIIFTLTPVSSIALLDSEWWTFDNTKTVGDGNTGYLGQQTQTVDGKALICDVYRVSYVKDPTVMEFESSNHKYTFYITIKVPVSYGGILFTGVEDSPILFQNPWGADAGAQAPGLNNTAVETNAALEQGWLIEGWTVVNAGMRGKTHKADGKYVGKLPNPFVDQKAALRYLHANEGIFPGDTNRIFTLGFSSGGNTSSIIGVSGNTALYETEMAEIGGLLLKDGARDEVYAALPGAPVITRNQGNNIQMWELFYDQEKDAVTNITNLKAINEKNGLMLENFVSYLNGLGITITIDGKKVPLTADNLDDYMLPFLEASADAAGETGWDGTWEGFWRVGDGAGFGGFGSTGGLGNTSYLNPAKDGWLNYDTFTSGTVTVNGRMTGGALSQGSFGTDDFASAVFSDVGLYWIQNKKASTVNVSQEYLDLYEDQRNSTDPMYFILGDGANSGEADAAVDIAQHWYTYHGAADDAVPISLTLIMNAALEMIGKNTQTTLHWKNGHSDRRDTVAVIAWAKDVVNQDKIAKTEVIASVKKLSGNKNNLTVAVYETLNNGKVITYSETFSISNNSSGTYQVGPYSVYVSTKGNDQIRACYIIE